MCMFNFSKCCALIIFKFKEVVNGYLVKLFIYKVINNISMFNWNVQSPFRESWRTLTQGGFDWLAIKSQIGFWSSWLYPLFPKDVLEVSPVLWWNSGSSANTHCDEQGNYWGQSEAGLSVNSIAACVGLKIFQQYFSGISEVQLLLWNSLHAEDKDWINLPATTDSRD